ncbi:oxidoreductase [Penicillium waksmanii]|uniref:oxidoreductase n=1 Tax=Penicillium waksmanii TaxID=69791 RepID=UPI0025499A8C|nr:oxidoreductase [Penicillium waksmanii]KAJ5995423.1 oxidoreductase [Penicillium waksmanii]
MPTNRAAWQDAAGKTLTIRPTPYPTNLSPTQILIKPSAWAINPCDYMLQDTALPFVKYPLILGEDISGTVIETGNSVTRFKANDLVLAFAQGAVRGAHMGGFQEYVVAEASFACLIPEYMKFSDGVVFPLCFTTASHALFNSKFLALPKPGLDIEPGSSGKSVLIWGGASAVGMNAIQLARAAGVEVYATASPRNFEYLAKLGASQLFDYTSENVVADIVAALNKSVCSGIFQAAGAESSVKPCLDVADKTDGDIFVVTTTPLAEGLVPEGVRAKMVFGDEHDDILEIWEKFLPQALFQKKYLIAPEPVVVEQKGLEGIQEGLDMLRKGVSAKKVVVVGD